MTLQCTHTHVEASLDVSTHTLTGYAECRTEPEHTPHWVATYPRVLQSTQGLNDLNTPWFYPYGFSPAHMDITYDGSSLNDGVAWQRLPEHHTHSTRVGFTTHIPERAGVFGYLNNTTYLLGGWHPVFSADRTLPTHALSYKIRIPENTVGFVGHTPFGRGPSRWIEGTHTGTDIPFLVTSEATVLSASPWVIMVPHGPYHLSTTQLDALKKTLEEGEKTLSSFETLRPEHPLIAVVAPLREHLTEHFSGGFAVSDRVFAVFPWKRFQLFHSMGVWRSQFFTRIAPFAAQREHPAHQALVADAVACTLRAEHVHTHYPQAESAHTLLNRIAVIPEIDALMFAPQTAFVDTYYNAVDETPAVRWRLDDYHHTLPRGKIVYEKMLDAQGSTYAYQTAHHYLTHAEPYAPVASHAYDAWLGPYPRVDYSLQRTPNGSALKVEVSGPDAHTVHEPVQVHAKDARGHTHTWTAFPPQDIPLNVPLPLAYAQLDPHMRLHEQPINPQKHPKYNNRTPPRWRLLLTHFSGLLGVTARQISVNADLLLRRIYDMDWSYSSKVMYSPRTASLYVGVHKGFGDPITALTRAHYAGVSAGYDYLRSNDVLGAPGHQATLAGYYVYDTRLRGVSSFEGRGFSARASVARAWKNTSDTYTYAVLGASALRLWPWGLRNALLLRMGMDGVLGKAPSQYGLRLGGRYRGIRGYEEDQAWGNVRATVSIEWRHRLASLQRHNLWGLLTLTDLEGALFADAAYFKSNICNQNGFYDAGYGLRVITEAFNISPMVIALDVGVPFVQCQPSRQHPFTVFLAFNQSFDPF